MVEPDSQHAQDSGQQQHHHQRQQAFPRRRLELTLVEGEDRERKADNHGSHGQAGYEEKIEAVLRHLVGRLTLGNLVLIGQFDLGAHGHRRQDGADEKGQDRKPGDE